MRFLQIERNKIKLILFKMSLLVNFFWGEYSKDVNNSLGLSLIYKRSLWHLSLITSWLQFLIIFVLSRHKEGTFFRFYSCYHKFFTDFFFLIKCFVLVNSLVFYHLFANYWMENPHPALYLFLCGLKTFLK